MEKKNAGIKRLNLSVLFSIFLILTFTVIQEGGNEL